MQQVKYLVTSETLFCDFEADLMVRKDYLERWILSLQAMSNVIIPENVRFVAILYLSEDKKYEASRLREFFSTLDSDTRTRFFLVQYAHPIEGYGLEDSTHPDLVKNPNKHAPRRDILFNTAVEQGISLDSAERIVRVAIDDDDLWLPWQLSQIVNAADAAFDSERIVGVGLSKACLAYVEEHKADVVDMARFMTGNKFYVGPVGLQSKLRKLSPWSLPERFGDPQVERFRRVGVQLKSTSGNVPGWVYGRWGKNLTVQTKRRYYKEVYETVFFESPATIVNSLENALKHEKRLIDPDFAMQDHVVNDQL